MQEKDGSLKALMINFFLSLISLILCLGLEVVHLTFLPHIFYVQLMSGACHINGQWVQVQNKIK